MDPYLKPTKSSLCTWKWSKSITECIHWKEFYVMNYPDIWCIRKWYFRKNKCQGCHQNTQFLHKEGDKSLTWWVPISGLRKNSLNLRHAYLSENIPEIHGFKHQPSKWLSWLRFLWFTKSLLTSIVSDTFYVSHNTQTTIIHLHVCY